MIEKRTGGGILLWGIVLALAGSRVIEEWTAPQAEKIWLPPLMATCFAAYLFVRLFADAARKIETVGLAGQRKALSRDIFSR